MIIVNPFFLYVFLRPITGRADEDEVVIYYQKNQLITEEQFRHVIRETLVAPFQNLHEEEKRKAKLALSYFLSKDDFNFERLFDSCLPPFDAPTNARDFFVWLWEELFGEESYLILDLKNYKVVKNVHEPNRSYK